MKNTILKLYQNQIFIWFCYFVVALFLYFRVLNNFFVSDDFHWLSLAKNRPWDWSIFLTNYEGLKTGGSYNPLLFIIFKLANSLFGLQQQWYHGVSILLHATNAWLVYILAKKLLSKHQLQAAYWASLCGLFFLIWPVQVEAISWIAAWPHLWATLFYLLSLIFYLKYSEAKKKSSLFLSIIFFIVGIMCKEIVMTLPLIIILLDWHSNYKLSFKKLGPYFVFLLLFFFLRWQSTGQVLGYYGQGSMGLKIDQWLGNLAIIFLNWASAGYFQGIFYKIWYHYLWVLVAGFLISLLAYVLYLWRFQYKQRLIIFLMLLISTIPILPLGLHRSTFAGERYLYLPTIFFVIWFISLLANLHLTVLKKMAIIFFMATCFLFIIHDKNITWFEAGKLSQQIVNSYEHLNLGPGAKLISVALPDNLRGAEVFRNNLQQALELYYPDKHPEIMALPVYVQLKNNQNYHLLSWRTDDEGWFLESIDRSFVVTGLTSITVNDVYFELWHYNYQNYTADLVRLIPSEELLSDLRQGAVKWLTFDRGELVVGR